MAGFEMRQRGQGCSDALTQRESRWHFRIREYDGGVAPTEGRCLGLVRIVSQRARMKLKMVEFASQTRYRPPQSEAAVCSGFRWGCKYPVLTN